MVKRCNEDIRQAAKEKGIFLWQIAERIPLCDTTFSKLLRRGLPPEKKAQVLRIIEQLAKEQENQ